MPSRPPRGRTLLQLWLLVILGLGIGVRWGLAPADYGRTAQTLSRVVLAVFAVLLGVVAWWTVVWWRRRRGGPSAEE